jgi:hypothetical protein
MNLSDVAARLYAVPPADFIRVRGDEAGVAKATGDASLSAAIRQLRKPSTAAWVVNALVRERPRPVGELLQLGEALRAAQLALAGDELKLLSRRQHQLLAELTTEAGRVAAEAGHRMTEATAREVTSTLQAAVADEAAAGAVGSGLLTRALTAGGFDAVDLDGAVAVEGELPALVRPGRAPLHSVAAPPEQPARPTSAAAKAAAKAADAAREAAALAERRLVRAEAALASAKDQLDDARGHLLDTQRALDAATRRLADAEAHRGGARRERESAARERDAARRALARAEAALPS